MIDIRCGVVEDCTLTKRASRCIKVRGIPVDEKQQQGPRAVDDPSARSEKGQTEVNAPVVLGRADLRTEMLKRGKLPPCVETEDGCSDVKRRLRILEPWYRPIRGQSPPVRGE